MGIDENTALIIEPASNICHVRGAGGVRVIRQGIEEHFETGASFGADRLGPFQPPVGHAGIDERIWDEVRRQVASRQERVATTPSAPASVLSLVSAREAAREERDWSAADSLREKIEAAGWQLQDTPDGPLLQPMTE